MLDTKIGKKGVEAAKDIYDWYQEFKEENPHGAKSLEAAGNILPLALVGKVLKTQMDTLKKTATTPTSTYKYKPNSDTPHINVRDTVQYQGLKDITTAKLNKINKFFNPDVINKALNSTDINTKVIYMTPGEFLTLAKTHTSTIETKKLDRINEAINKGIQLEDIPTLTIQSGKSGGSQVIKHDGRHRANALYELGEELIPVRVVIKGNKDNKRIFTVTNEDGLEVYTFPTNVIYNRKHLGEAELLIKDSTITKLAEGGLVLQPTTPSQNDYVPRSDEKREVILGEDQTEVYGAAVTTSASDIYKSMVEDTAKAYGITPESMHFNQPTTVKYTDDSKDKGSAISGTTHYNPDNSADYTYFLGEKDYQDVAHELPHPLSHHLAAMDETGGLREKTADKLSPDFSITSYGYNESNLYIKDYNSKKTTEERFELFRNKVLSNKSFKMRKELKEKVATAVGRILSDPIAYVFTSVGTEYFKEKGKKAGYFNRPEEIWARAMSSFIRLKKLQSEGHTIDPHIPGHPNYKDAGEMLYIKDKDTGISKSVDRLRINQETFDAIQEMVDEFKQEKYTISKKDISKQMQALTLSA